MDAATVALIAALVLPNPTLTPGAVRHDLTIKQICSTRWGVDRRHVTAKMKREVYARYGLSGPRDPACVPDKHRRTCEIDHLIPRSLGGADVPDNLAPQPYGTQPWNAARKDRLEARLSREVCKGETTLKAAREAFKYDFRQAYIERFGQPEE